LANQQKINAYKAQEKQLKDEAGFWRNNKRQYTAEQLEGFNRTREELYSSLGAIDDEGIVELNRLTTLITTDENGNTLSIEEIKQKAKDNPEFKVQLEKYEKLANKYKKPMIEGAKTEDFYKQLGKTYAAATEISRAETALTNAKTLANNYEKISKQVSVFKEKETEHKKAQEALNVATSAVENFGNQYVTVDANGKVVAKEDANFRGMLTPLEGTNLSDETTLNEYIDKLKNMGVPESVVTTIQNAAANPGESGDVANSIESAINSLNDDQLSEVSENVIQHQQTKYDELKTKKSEAEANVTNNPKPSKDDPEFADIKDMTDEQLIEYDVTTDAGKQTQKSIEDGLKEAETQVKKIQKDRETRAAKRKAENEEYQAMQKRKIPDEFKDEVNKAKSGLDVGETKVDGKPGIRVPKLDENGNPVKKEDGTPDYDFIPKPDPNASDDEQKEYDRKKDKLVLNTKLGDASGESIERRNGEYYYKNGDVEIKLDPNNPSDKSEITRIYAEQQIRAEQRALILGKKQELADKLSKCIKDGDLDPAVYKTMSNAEKEALRDIVSGKVSVDDMFAGVDLAGSSVKDSVNNFKKQHKDLVTAENGEDGNGKDKGSFEEYMKDLDDEAEDKGFDGDADHDDEDNVEDDEKGLLNDEGDLETDEDEEYTDDEGNTKTRKKKLKNPAKIWRRKKKKNGKGTTSSYYNKEGDSISKKEFKKRMATYKEALKKKKDKQSSTNTDTTTNNTTNTGGERRVGDASKIDYTNLSNWLFEKLLNNI
jgi:hypothetical protein